SYALGPDKRKVSKFAALAGNIRIDSLTLSRRSEDYSIRIFRGQYSPQALFNAIEKAYDGKFEKVTVDGVDTYRFDSYLTLITPSNEHLIVLIRYGGDAKEETKQIVAAIKAESKKPTFSDELKELVAKADRTKLGWCAFLLADDIDKFSKHSPLKPFRSIVGHVSRDAPKAISFSYQGTGSNPKAIADVVAEAKKTVGRMLRQDDPFGDVAPFKNILKGIKFDSTYKQATAKFKVDNAAVIILNEMLPPAIKKIDSTFREQRIKKAVRDKKLREAAKRA
ncbi:MAG: hypothetical protein ACR2RE_28355, partial [Geminicoccaceae bacterium]